MRCLCDCCNCISLNLFLIEREFFSVTFIVNSKNIINAVKVAKNAGVKVIGMTGYDGGALYELADYHLHAPINDMMKAEDIHMSFDHMMATILLHVLDDIKVNK